VYDDRAWVRYRRGELALKLLPEREKRDKTSPSAKKTSCLASLSPQTRPESGPATATSALHTSLLHPQRHVNGRRPSETADGSVAELARGAVRAVERKLVVDR
jgi:hypothetical protein